MQRTIGCFRPACCGLCIHSPKQRLQQEQHVRLHQDPRLPCRQGAPCCGVPLYLYRVLVRPLRIASKRSQVHGRRRVLSSCLRHRGAARSGRWTFSAARRASVHQLTAVNTRRACFQPTGPTRSTGNPSSGKRGETRQSVRLRTSRHATPQHSPSDGSSCTTMCQPN